MSSREDAYSSSVELLVKQMGELINALKTNPPDFIILELARCVHGTAGDVIDFSPSKEWEDNFDKRELSSHEIDTLAELVRRYDTKIKAVADNEWRAIAERYINGLINEMRATPRDNRKIRRLKEMISAIYTAILGS